MGHDKDLTEGASGTAGTPAVEPPSSPATLGATTGRTPEAVPGDAEHAGLKAGAAGPLSGQVQETTRHPSGHGQPITGQTAHQEAPQDLLERVILAAMELFGSRGYRGTTLQEIAERCGVSKPTLYKHFRSKADLYEAVVLHVHRQYVAGARQALASAQGIRQKLAAYLNFQFEFAVRNAPLLKTLHSIMFLPEDVRPQINHALFAEERFGLLMELLREAAAQGTIRGDPMDVGLAVAGLGGLGVVQALLPSVPILQQGLAERLCDLLFDGIAGPAERKGGKE